MNSTYKTKARAKRLAVQNILQEMEGRLISVEELGFELKSFSSQDLLAILREFEKTNQIVMSPRGISWIGSPKQKLIQGLEL